MRWLVLTTALTTFCSIAEAREHRSREPLARPMERTPSIMVGGEEASPRKAARRPSALAKGGAARGAAARPRPIVVPRASGLYEAETRAINRSISEQGQLLQLQQHQQVENNLFRQELQRSTGPSFGCTPGSLGC